MPVISVLKRLRLGDHRLQASLGYIVRPCFKKQINKEDLIKLRDPVWSFHHISKGKKSQPKSDNSLLCVYSGVTLTWLFQRNYHKDINTYQVSTTMWSYDQVLAHGGVEVATKSTKPNSEDIT